MAERMGSWIYPGGSRGEENRRNISLKYPKGLEKGGGGLISPVGKEFG